MMSEWMNHGEFVSGTNWGARCTCEAVPFQLEGTLSNGKHLYWRSRHVGWQFGIGSTLEEAVTVAMQTSGAMPSGSMGVRQVVAAEGHPLGTERIADVVPIIDKLVAVYLAGLKLIDQQWLHDNG